MFKTNDYFDGKVKSISFENAEGPTTAGVMAAGEYEFGTSSVEYMTVTSGKMEVLLPEKKNWKAYYKSETFVVPAQAKFKVKVKEDTSYICRYE